MQLRGYFIQSDKFRIDQAINQTIQQKIQTCKNCLLPVNKFDKFGPFTEIFLL